MNSFQAHINPTVIKFQTETAVCCSSNQYGILVLIWTFNFTESFPAALTKKQDHQEKHLRRASSRLCVAHCPLLTKLIRFSCFALIWYALFCCCIWEVMSPRAMNHLNQAFRWLVRIGWASSFKLWSCHSLSLSAQPTLCCMPCLLFQFLLLWYLSWAHQKLFQTFAVISSRSLPNSLRWTALSMALALFYFQHVQMRHCKVQ